MKYADARYPKYHGLKNGVGFIDETVVYASRPTSNSARIFEYNGHNIKHTLKFKSINSPDVFILLI